jgi:uncharacterized protein with PIN domain
MKKLEWVNLKNDFCPKCYGELENDDTQQPIKCLACDFSISRIRYDEIIEDMEKEEAGNNAENA